MRTCIINFFRLEVESGACDFIPSEANFIERYWTLLTTELFHQNIYKDIPPYWYTLIKMHKEEIQSK
jgi:hypothetical protein